MVSLCQAIRCNACCFFPNGRLIEKNGFSVSAEYDRPVDSNKVMPENAFLAAKKYDLLNDPLPRERLSPCSLLDERGFCCGHAKYDKKNEKMREIYCKGINTDPEYEIEARCGEFTCDFFDEHHVFFRKHEKELLSAFESLDSQLERMDFLVSKRKDYLNDKKNRKKLKIKAKKFVSALQKSKK